jgi:hypothetical protein
MDWLTEFYDYEILEGKPIRIQINEVYGDYKPLPRKSYNKEERAKQKQEDYSNYVKLHLHKEFTPESKAHMSRKAIMDFGMDRYNHISDEAVAKRYVGPAMEKYGEKSDNYYWVYYDTYKKMSQKDLDAWFTILNHNQIGEQEAANAFYRQEQGEDVTKEKNAFKAALKEFKEKYHSIPVKVPEWRLKR